MHIMCHCHPVLEENIQWIISVQTVQENITRLIRFRIICCTWQIMYLYEIRLWDKINFGEIEGGVSHVMYYSRFYAVTGTVVLIRIRMREPEFMCDTL